MTLTRTGVLTLGATGFAMGLLRFTHWWHHRKDGPGIGYIAGEPVALQLVTIDGKPVETHTASAFIRMRKAAAADDVELSIVSAFRTMAEQEYLYRCYRTGDCNNGNYADPPGFSEHQSGRALDLNTRIPGVHPWLVQYAREYGFYATVPSEPWHWEYWGKTPPFLS